MLLKDGDVILFGTDTTVAAEVSLGLVVSEVMVP